jgi:hypothetical protein
MKTLKEYYDWVEQQNVHDHHHVSTSIKKLQDELINQSEKDILKAEIFAMDFMLRDGKIEGVYKTTTEEGDTIFEYPNPKDITPEMVEYYFERINKTKNASAKSRYAQVALNCCQKVDTAKAVQYLVDSYISFIRNLISQPFVAGERCYMIRSAFENFYLSSIKSKYRSNDTNELLKKNVFEDGTLSASFRVSMIEFLFIHRRNFDKSVLVEIASLCEKLYNKGDTSELRVMEDLYKVALSIVQSTGGDAKLWHNRLAEAYELEINNNTHDESGIGAMEMCRNALQKYRLAKNEIKIAELTVLYAELRKKLKFGKIEHNFDVKELNKHFNQFKKSFKKILKNHSPHDIIIFFVNEPKLFPPLLLLKKRVQNRKKGFLDFITLLKLDINKNFQIKISSKEERELNALYEAYHFDMQLYVSHQIQLIFYLGFTHGKINYQTLINYIKEKTWIGQNLSRIDSGGELRTYNWLSVLGPGLFELFSAIEASFKRGNGALNIVLALDSLTLKFEGLLRDFARLTGAETVVQVKDIIREMYIEDLLETEQIQNFFTEDDRMFFKYVFVSKYGLNLRNQIAHSFLKPHQYNLDKVLLVLVAILRLGKYNINTNNPVT